MKNITCTVPPRDKWYIGQGCAEVDLSPLKKKNVVSPRACSTVNQKREGEKRK
jgi:hypothetical protein